MVSHPTSAHRRSVLLVAVLAALWGTSLVGGIEAQVARPPQRIVSLVPATTEMLFAIGTGPRVIGVGSYDRYPPDVNTRPKLGGLLDPNIEQLIALRPDLVIAYDTQTELRRQLERANIPAWTWFSLDGTSSGGDHVRPDLDSPGATSRA